MSRDGLKKHAKTAGQAPTKGRHVIGEMRALLVRLRPSCTAAALNALHKAFPAAPLKDRTEAYEAYAANFRRVFPHNDE